MTERLPDVDEEWVREAERLHRRYLMEIVEAYDLCPWAQRARTEGRTRISVVLEGEEQAVAPSISSLDRWALEGVEIGFIVFPRLRLDRLEFDRFVSHLRSSDAERHPLGKVPFALAAFHPEALPDVADPERLIPFLRRTPDPCVQAIQMATLERVRRGAPAGTQFIDVASLDAIVSEEAVVPSLRDRIARANLDTVRRAGVQALRSHLDAIQQDRVRTYRALEAREACLRESIIAESALGRGSTVPPAPASKPPTASRT